jgi:hypothetical protein
MQGVARLQPCWQIPLGVVERVRAGVGMKQAIPEEQIKKSFEGYGDVKNLFEVEVSGLA